MRVRLYGGFAADQRISMQVYAQQLLDSVQSQNIDIDLYTPHSSWEKYQRSRWVMRALRYLHYPRQISAAEVNVHHVVDHGYAHLHKRFKHGASCVTVHDLIPLLVAKGVIESSQSARNPWLNKYSLSFLNHFDCVVAPSQHTAQDVAQHLGLNEENIAVIPPMLSDFGPRPTAEQLNQFCRRHSLPRDTQWMLITGQEFYKNHETSLQVLRKLREQNYEVRILKTGVLTAEFGKRVHELGLERFVHSVFLPKQAEMKYAYALASCLLFPSLYEGFGMPVIEALHFATPVVCSSRGSLDEVGGAVVDRCDPFDVESLAHSVLGAFEKAKVASFVAACDAYVANFKPTTVAESWRTLYLQLAAGAG